MTKADFLSRCATAYDAGLITPESLRLLREWTDAMLRYQHTQFSDGQGQGKDWLRFLHAEFQRTDNGKHTLANDHDGYGLVQLTCLLAHKFQECATSKDAWWTRPGFCQHKN